MTESNPKLVGASDPAMMPAVTAIPGLRDHLDDRELRQPDSLPPCRTRAFACGCTLFLVG